LATGEDEGVDRPANRTVDSRSGESGTARPDAGDRCQRIQPRHDDRGGSGKHGQGPIAGEERYARAAGSLWAAPPLYRREQRAAVWRRVQAGLPLRRDGGGTALFGDQGSDFGDRSPCDDLPRDGDFAADGVYDREAAVLRYGRWE